MPHAEDKGSAGARREISSAREKSKVQPSFASHRRKTRTILKTQRLVLEDVEGAEACLAAQEAVGEAEPLFGNVAHLSMGSDLAFALSRDRIAEPAPLHARMGQMLRPRHLCVKYRIDSEWERSSKCLVRNGISAAVEAFERYWALDSITCHDIMAERVPLSDAPRYRTFFRTDPPPHDRIALVFLCAKKRAHGVSDVIRPFGPPDESTFEFVDIGCSVCRIAGKRGAEQKKVERMVFENIPQTGLKEIIQPKVRFSTAFETAERAVFGDR